MENVKTRDGLLIIPKGFEMNGALRERMRSYDQRLLRTTVRVMLGGSPDDVL